MAIWQPTRRELIKAAPLVASAAPLRASLPGIGSRNLKLFVLGDWGRDGAAYQRHVATLMDHEARQSGCDLVVSTGDNFYRYGVSGSHDPQWRTSYEAIYSPELRGRPWFPVAGNHDWGGSIWAQLDRTGTGNWHMPWLWYDISGARFGRPDVHLFFIDTLVWKGSETNEFGICGQAVRPEDTEQQKTWLAAALRASCAPTKLVFGHHPIFYTGAEGGGHSLRQLEAMLKEAKVTAYICGHRHCLFHIRDDQLDYICSGGGSEERPKDTRGNFGLDCVREGRCTPQLERFIGKAGFASFDIGAEVMSFSFVDRDGRKTPPVTIASRGNHGLACTAAPPVDTAIQREHARARAKTYFPCAALT